MPDDNKYVNSQREVYQDPQGNTHTRVTHNAETVHNDKPEVYRDGYTHGRIAEQRYQEENQIARDNDNAARGLLLGIILTSIVALGAGLYYVLSQRNNDPVVTPTVTTPAPSPQATFSPTPTPEKTINELLRPNQRFGRSFWHFFCPTCFKPPQFLTTLG